MAPAGGEERLDTVVSEVRARGHRVGERRLAVARLEKRGRICAGGGADVAALRVEDDEESDRARVVADLLERPCAVGTERLEERRLGLDPDDVREDGIDDPLAEARDRRCGCRAPEHGLAAKLHREQVEPRIETDEELAVLPLDRLSEAVGEPGGTRASAPGAPCPTP